MLNALDYRFFRFANKMAHLKKGIGVMYERSSIELLNQTKVTRRVALALILLAFGLPSLFAWGDKVALENAGMFTMQLAAVTLLAFIARLWAARHYSAGVQVQALLAFALVLICWSGYVSRTARDERVAAAAASVSSMPSRIPDQVAPGNSKSQDVQR